jgi:hypothetical protein
MNTKNWKKIADFPKYKVSRSGDVFSSLKYGTKSRILKKFVDKDGYLVVCLRSLGVKKTIKVHRLVASAYIKNNNNYPQVNHIDGNKQNNFYRNLQWCSCKENILHARDSLGCYYKKRKVTSEMLQKIPYEYHNTKITRKTLGLKYGVSKATIDRLLP